MSRLREVWVVTEEGYGDTTVLAVCASLRDAARHVEGRGGFDRFDLDGGRGVRWEKAGDVCVRYYARPYPLLGGGAG